MQAWGVICAGLGNYLRRAGTMSVSYFVLSALSENNIYFALSILSGNAFYFAFPILFWSLSALRFLLCLGPLSTLFWSAFGYVLSNSSNLWLASPCWIWRLSADF